MYINASLTKFDGYSNVYIINDMATKQQIFEKIGVLLEDINDQMQALGTGVEGDTLKTDLFEATVNYFAAHVGVYNKLLKEELKQPAETGTAEQHIADTVAVPADDEIIAEDGKGTTTEELDDPGVDDGVRESDEVTEEPADEESAIIFTPESQSNDVEDEPLETAEPVEEIVDQDPADEPVEDTKEMKEDSSADQGEQPDEADPKAAQGNGDEQESAPAASVPVADDVKDEPVQPDTGQPAPDDQRDANEATHEVTIEEKTFAATEADLPAPAEEKPQRPLSINEIMSAQRKAGSNPVLGMQRGDGAKITDLKSAISLNDKLLFIKDLFNGYSLAYSEAIELLNRYDDFASAETFLQTNYAQKNNWAEKPATVDKLYAVMRKRFGN